MELEDIFDKLFDYFQISSISELAEKLEVSQPTVSKWKARNSLLPIKKKCRELGIYNEIFGDKQEIDTNNGINAFNSYGDAKQSSDSSLKFDDDITAILHTASTVVDEKNKDSFKKLIKEWIVENI